MMAAIFNEAVSTREPNVTSFIFTNFTQKAEEECVELQTEDSPDSLVSSDTLTLVLRVKDIVLLPILFLIGGPGNVINMAVFRKQGLKERINVCLFSLALADFGYLLFNMAAYGEKLYMQFINNNRYGSVMQFMANNNLMGFNGFAWVSEIMSAIIASERCFCIMQPLRSQTVLSTSTTTAIIAMVYVVVMGLYFFVNTRYRMICAYDPRTNANTLTFTAGQFYLKHQKVIDFFEVFVFGVGIPLVMITVVVVMTTITVIKLRKAAAWRAGSSSSAVSSSGSSSMSAREMTLNVMLVYNSIFFSICVFPYAVFGLLLLFLPDVNAGGRQHNLFFTFLFLLDALSAINGTFNIVIYYTVGSRYRQTFWQLFGRGSKKSRHTRVDPVIDHARE